MILKNTYLRPFSFIFIFFALGAGSNALAQTILLDDFESGSIRITNSGESDPQARYLWNQYEGDFTDGPDPGSESVTNETGPRWDPQPQDHRYRRRSVYAISTDSWD